MNQNIRFEIIVEIDGTQYYLDTYDIRGVPLNLSIADIKDISKRNSSYSLSIEVPETSHNRFIFNSISDLSSDLTYFNPNKKSPVIILVDTVVVFTGNLQMTGIEFDDASNETKYTCVVYNESDSFFKEIDQPENNLLTDLDFSELNHIWGTTSIINSWSNQWSDGYFYPLIDYTGNLSLFNINGNSFQGPSNSVVLSPTQSTMRVTDFYPATFVKYVWDKIFTNAGYRYNSNFLNSDTFNNLLMPFNNGILRKDPELDVNLNFGVAKSSIQDTSQNMQIFGGADWFGWPGGIQFKHITYDYDVGIFDSGGIWSTVSSTFTQPNYGTGSGYRQRFTIYTKLAGDLGTAPLEWKGVVLVRSGDPATNFTTQISGWTFSPTLLDFNKFVKIPSPSGWLYYNIANVENNPVTSDPAQNPDCARGYGGFYGGLNFFDVYGQTEFLDEANISFNNPAAGLYYNPLQPGEEVRVYQVKYTSQLYPGVTQSAVCGGTQAFEWSYIYNEVDTLMMPGMRMDYNSAIPANVKQKDFINSIVKMFNLYIEPDKNDKYLLNIEPRDDYYASGQIKDWTDKLDLNYTIEQEVLADVQDKSTLFTYKKDDDYFNKDYEGKLKRIYGDIKYTIDNDFSKGEKKIEVIFSQTPGTLMLGSRDLYLPQIFKLDNGQPKKADKFNIRILRKKTNGLIQLGSIDNWFLEGQRQDKYPYIGHFDDPVDPTEDLCFGQTYLYTAGTSPTNNNLFNRFWKKTMNELTDINSKIVTAYFYLTETDINKFKFNDSIFVQIDGVGGYYRVNKIINYDPTKRVSTKVELLKVIDRDLNDYLTTDAIQSENIVLPGSPGANGTGVNPGPVSPVRGGLNPDKFSFIKGIDNVNGGRYNITTGVGNLNLSSNSIIMGSSNYSSEGLSKMMIGNNNYDRSFQKSFVLGDGNILSSSQSVLNDVYVLGSNNAISFTQSVTGSNIYILGSNVTASSPDTTYISNNNLVFNVQNITYGNTQSTLLYQEVTYTDLTTNLIPGGLLTAGMLYKIDTQQTTYKDNGIFLKAISVNQLEKWGSRLFLAPLTYDTGSFGGFTWLGVWQSTLTPAIGDLAIWGGLVWSNVNGNVGSAVSQYALDAEWSVVGKDSFTTEYVEVEMVIKYDLTNNWVEKQYDKNNNIVGISYEDAVLLALTNENPCDISDWNYQSTGQAIFMIENNVPRGFYNNICNLYYNFCMGIWDNRISGNISTNVTNKNIYSNTNSGDINNNNNIGDIYLNSCNGSIQYNMNQGEIYNNSNAGNIQWNMNAGNINTNSNNGDIRYNKNGDEIASNSNNGDIAGNQNAGNIKNNSNDNSISGNANNGLIQGNIAGINFISGNLNNGSIINNSGVGGPWNIISNINNGQIGQIPAGPARVADVTDPVVNK